MSIEEIVEIIESGNVPDIEEARKYGKPSRLQEDDFDGLLASKIRGGRQIASWLAKYAPEYPTQQHVAYADVMREAAVLRGDQRNAEFWETLGKYYRENQFRTVLEKCRKPKHRAPKQLRSRCVER